MSLDKHRNANGTYDGVGVMAELTGLGRGEIAAIAEQVKANQARLNSCAYHEFEPTGDPLIKGVREAYACKRCGGTIDWSAYRWHELGRRPRP